MKLLIGIPAYNEEKTIGKVIKSIPKRIKKTKKVEILVVDDGSSDGTSQAAKRKGAHVISHLINRGLGGALKTIFLYARKIGADILITIDADGQHDPSSIETILMDLTKKNCDVVVGSRWIKNKNINLSRFIVNKMANWFTFILFGIKTTDSQSGFRAFNKKAIQTINLTSDGMEVSSEFFREIYLHRLKYSEVPIKAIYTEYSLKKGQSLSNAPSVLFQLVIRYLR